MSLDIAELNVAMGKLVNSLSLHPDVNIQGWSVTDSSGVAYVEFNSRSGISSATNGLANIIASTLDRTACLWTVSLDRSDPANPCVLLATAPVNIETLAFAVNDMFRSRRAS